MKGMRLGGTLAWLALALVGCQWALGSEGAYLCKDNQGCPAGKACARSVGVCVDPCDTTQCTASGGTCNDDTQQCDITGAMDASEPDGGEPTEAGPSKPYPLGIGCAVDTDCTSKLCADARHLATTTFSKVGSICSKSCCSSTDCGQGLVCQSNGKGARYCVPSRAVGRSSQGTKSGGAACTGSEQCVSGLCTNGRCVDTCCVASQCQAPTECRFDALDGIRGWHCFAPPPAATGGIQASCTASTQCKSNLCVNTCRTPCCSDTQCGAASGMLAFCAYEYKSLVQEQPLYCLGAAAPGSLAGETCTSDVSCKSGFCDEGKCATPCCVDSDCGGTMKCKPDIARGLPRCVMP